MLVLFVLAFFAVVLAPAGIYVAADVRAAHAQGVRFWDYEGE